MYCYYQFAVLEKETFELSQPNNRDVNIVPKPQFKKIYLGANLTIIVITFQVLGSFKNKHFQIN